MVGWMWMQVKRRIYTSSVTLHPCSFLLFSLALTLSVLNWLDYYSTTLALQTPGIIELNPTYGLPLVMAKTVLLAGLMVFSIKIEFKRLTKMILIGTLVFLATLWVCTVVNNFLLSALI